MSEQKVIEFEFDLATGEVIVETKGFVGDECMQAAEAITKTLGKTTGVKKKRDWYETNLKAGRNVKSNLCG